MNETKLNILNIDKDTYKINKKNHYKTKNPKTQIIIGSTLRKKNFGIVRLQHKEFGLTKTWNHFTISRNGQIYQHFNDENHSDFLGIKSVDKQIISILLENMGSLYKIDNDVYVNWLSEICSIDDVVECNWLGYKYWEKYTDEQINSLVELIKMLCNKHSIPKELIDFNHYHEKIIKFKGIVFRSNHIENSDDINPLFNITEFNEKIKQK